MPKKMMMTIDFVEDVYRLLYALQDVELDYPTQDVIKRLRREIQGKIEALERREAFTNYKTTSPTDEREREKCRQEYLDLAGIHREWRSSKEIPDPVDSM